MYSMQTNETFTDLHSPACNFLHDFSLQLVSYTCLVQARKQAGSYKAKIAVDKISFQISRVTSAPLVSNVQQELLGTSRAFLGHPCQIYNLFHFALLAFAAAPNFAVLRWFFGLASNRRDK